MPVNDRIIVDAATVASQLHWLRTTFPELDRDADLLASAVEGETDFDKVMERITDAALDADTVAEAIKLRESNLAARRLRYERKAAAMRALALGMMTAAGQKTTRLPEATLSIAAGKPRLVIDNADELPQGLYRNERVPLKADLLVFLAAGNSVPGAHIEPPKPHLSIRVK